MNLFVDTSGFLAVLDADDDHHGRAMEEWVKLLTSGANLVTNNYVLVETFALLQHRLGLDAARTFHEEILPVVKVHWVDEVAHVTAVSVLLAASRRRLSLVDCTSFETMRRLGLKNAFALDSHFREQGFKCMP